MVTPPPPPVLREPLEAPHPLVHFLSYAFTMFAGYWSVTLFLGQTWLPWYLGTLGVGAIVGFVAWRWQRTLAALAILGVAVSMAGCLFVARRLQPTPVSIIEWSAMLLVACRALAATTPRHYATMGLMNVMLLPLLIRRLGAAPPALLLPFLILATIWAVSLVALRPPGESGSDQRSRMLPWTTWSLRVIVVAGAVVVGGEIIARGLPMASTVGTRTGVGNMHDFVLLIRSALGLETPTAVAPAEDERFISGDGYVMDLEKTDPSKLSNRLDFVVYSPRAMYLRSLVLDHYTGRRWLPSGDFSLRRLTSGRGGGQVLIPGGSTAPVKIDDTCRVWAQSRQGLLLSLPSTAGMLDPVDLGHIYADALGNIFGANPIVPGSHYACTLRRLEIDSLAGVAIGGDEEGLAERYLQLPKVSQRLIAHCQQATWGEKRRLAAVLKLQALVVQGKRYTLAPQVLPPDVEAAEYFLFESSEGACEQYANALSVACRIVGIPARLVTGYAPGTWKPAGGYYEVRERDAHAWTQVWFPKAGWVDFDATPIADEQFQPQPVAARQDPAEVFMTWQQRLMVWHHRLAEGSTAAWKWFLDHLYWLWYGLTALILLVPLALVARVAAHRLLWGWRWWRSLRQPPRLAVATCYQYALEALRRRGLAVTPSLTPTEIAALAQAAFPSLGEEFAQITREVEAWVFGTVAPTPEEVLALRTRISAFVRGIRPRPPPRSPAAG